MLRENILQDKYKSKILARVVAHLMGDGCVSNKYFAYYNKNQTLIDNFERDIKDLFENVHIIKGKVNSGAMFRMVQNKAHNQFLKSLHSDYRSFAIFIPEFINTKELQAEFLRALFDDEGCVALREFRKTNEIKRNITLSSNSEKILIQIKFILLDIFNIHSNKLSKYVKTHGNKMFTNYVLSITGKSNFEKFENQIGFNHPLKKEKLVTMLNSYRRVSATK